MDRNGSRVARYVARLKRKAERELRATVKGEKRWTEPAAWKPAAYAAAAPERGVTLEGGPLREAFERNLGYLAEWFAKSDRGSRPADEKNWWETCLAASSEGRMLGVAGHSLRWGERAEARDILNTLIDRIKARQTPAGYCLPYPEEELRPNTNGGMDERRNYDRVNLTRGLAAAGLAGHPDALAIVRRFYDWFNVSPYLPYTLAGYFDASPERENSWAWPGELGSSHNCSNGLEGHLLAHLSAVGKPEDLVAALRYLVQDWFLEASARREPLSLSHYPCHVAHSYVLLSYLFWLDMYRATGGEKFLQAALGAWEIVRDHFLHIGGSLAICENTQGAYPPDSYYLRVDHQHHTGETCGSVFWADINHRLLQLFPHDARYADEIEQVVYNVILANQDARGHIRYHARLQGRKEEARSINTCCEVFGTPFIARLPQYLYSLADDGLYVNLFAPSSIAWTQAGAPVSLRCATEFPFRPEVELRVEAATPAAWRLRLRVPTWAGAAMPCRVNGEPAGAGEPGAFLVLDRVWRTGDTVTFALPPAWRTVRYRGVDEDAKHPRYALMKGPVLMALTGADDLALTPDDLLDRLREDAPLQARIEGIENARYQPYWTIQDVTFTCFPTLRATEHTGAGVEGRR
jgi:hypothetical protein